MPWTAPRLMCDDPDQPIHDPFTNRVETFSAALTRMWMRANWRCLGSLTHVPVEASPSMMKLFYTPASPFVRKCTVTVRELGLQDRVEIVPTKWPHSWGTETVPYREDFLAATPIARIPRW